jgi:uncharacterized membrane protein (DUF106 family)
MDLFNAIFDSLLRFFFNAFSWAPPVVGLSVVAAATGIGLLWVWSKTSDQSRMKKVKDSVWAALFELRVYVNEPRVTWRAQKALVDANFRYMGLALRPTLWMIAPMALLLVHLNSFYGHAPLPVDRETIVTMGMSSTWDPHSPAPQLLAPPQVLVTSFPVRAPDAREISWRIRPVAAVSGQLTFLVDGKRIPKLIEAGPRRRFIPGRSVNSALQLLWMPAERRIGSNTVEWIEISYPEAYLSVLGVQWNWLMWFFAVSIVAALLLKKRFGVVI